MGSREPSREPLPVGSVLVGVACAALAGALVLLATRRGITLEQDSTTYLSAARNLAAGHGYQDFTDQPLTNFPPLFPALIRAVMWVFPSAVTAARAVNAVAFAGSSVLAFALIRRHTESRFVLICATSLAVFSIGLLHVADKALSEPLFCVFVYACLLALESALMNTGRRSTGFSLAAGALAGLAFLTRYAGVVLIAVGVGAILLSWRRSREPGVTARLLAFLAAAFVMPVVWIARNAATGSENLLGPRAGSGLSLVSLLRETARGAGSVFLPQNLGWAAEATFWTLVAFAVFAVAVRHRFSARRADRGETTTLPLSLFVLVYVPFIAWTNVTSGTSLNFRIFSPIYVPVLVLGVALVDRLYPFAGHEDRKPLRALIVAGALGLVGFAVVGTSYDAWRLSASAHGYASREFTASPLTRSVERLPADALVASNDPYLLYGATGREPVVLSPGVQAAGNSVAPTSLKTLTRHATCEGPVYLAWYGPADRGPSYLDKPGRLARGARIQRLGDFRDGTLYSLDPFPSGPAASC